MTERHVCATWFVRDVSLLRLSAEGETWFIQWKTKGRRATHHRLFAICNDPSCDRGRYLYFDKEGAFVKFGPICKQ